MMATGVDVHANGHPAAQHGYAYGHAGHATAAPSDAAYQHQHQHQQHMNQQQQQYQQHQQQAPTNTAPSAGVRRQNPPAPARKERPPSPPPTLHDASGTRSTFKVGHLLGEGGFARCFAVTDQDGNRLAVKVVHKPSLKSTKQRNKLLSEIKIHKSLSHPGVVKFHHVFEDDVNVYMILELCENRTLADMLKKRKRLTELEVRYYMHQLLDSIRYMHRHGVIHRDIKLGNLFLAKNMSLKIGDFGLAAVIKHDGERKKTICGTPNYIAPEVLFNKEGHSFEVDVWSLGIVMYTLVIGKPPFQTNDVNSIYERIRENNYEFPPSIPISNDVRTIIQSLLNSNPEHRPSIDDVLEHPFFASEPIPIQIPVSALLSPPVIEASNLTRLNNVAYNTSSSSSSGSGSGNSIGNGGGGGGAAQTVAPDYHYPAPSGSAHAYDGPQQQQPSEPPLATLIDRSSPQNDARGPQSLNSVEARPFHDPSRVPGAIRAQRTKSALSMDRLSVGNAPAQGQTRPPASVDRANIGVVSSPWSPPRDQQPWAGLMAPDQRQSATAPAAPVPAPATRSLTTPPPTSAVNSQAAAAAGSAGMLATSEMPRTRNRSPTAPAAEPVASGWPDQAPPLPKRLSGVVPGQTTPSSLLSPAKASTSKPSASLEELLQILSVALDKRAGGSGGSNSPVDNLSSGLEAFGLNGSGSSLAHPDLFVTKWIDYSNKYGLGYQLRDGSVGVYFNDSTSIILAADGMHFEYLHCGKALDKAAMHREAYTLEQHPSELNKKVTLLKHFRSYMQENLYKACNSDLQQPPKTRGLDYLTKYMRTKNGVLFRLNNQTLQLNLFDHTKLILSGRGRIVTFISADREMRTQTLEWFLQQGSADVIDRLCYIRDVIQQMITKKHKRTAADGDGAGAATGSG